MVPPDILAGKNYLHLHEAIFNSISDAVIFADTTRRIQTVNPAFTKIWGYDLHEIKGETTKRLYADPADYDAQGAKRYHPETRSENQIFELQYRRKDGSVFWGESLGAKVRDAEGRVIGFVGIHRDISDRKITEEKIESLSRFPGENPSPVLRVDKEGGVIYANRSSRIILDHIGCSVGAVLPDAYRPYLEEAFECNRAGQFEMQVNDRTFLFSISPVREFGYANLYGMEITERKKIEADLQRSEERYRLAQKAANIGSWDWDIPTGRLYWSDDIESMFGFEKGKFDNTFEGFLKCVHPEDRDCVSISVERALLYKEEYNIEHRIVYPDDSVHWVSETGAVMSDSVGNPVRMLGVVRDITERKQAEEKIRILTRSVEQSPAAVIISCVAGTIQYVNPAFTVLSGYAPEDVMGKSLDALKSDGAYSTLYEGVWKTVCAGREWRGEFTARIKSGERIWVSGAVTPVSDDKDRIINYLAICQDITDRKTEEERIRRLAFHDPLTGLPNRKCFRTRLSETLTALKKSPEKKIALLYIDLDRFKPVNDAHGHEAGDQVLKIVAERLKNCIKKTDVAARLGGDEFALLLSDVENMNDLIGIANRVLESLNAEIEINETKCLIGASIGISLHPDHGDTVDALINKADDAMYAAKNAGKNQFRFYRAPREHGDRPPDSSTPA